MLHVHTTQKKFRPVEKAGSIATSCRAAQSHDAGVAQGR